MSECKIASGFAPFSPCADRFNVAGYREPMSLAEQFTAAAAIRGFGGVGLDYPYQFTKAEEVRPLLATTGLKFVSTHMLAPPSISSSATTSSLAITKTASN